MWAFVTKESGRPDSQSHWHWWTERGQEVSCWTKNRSEWLWKPHKNPLDTNKLINSERILGKLDSHTTVDSRINSLICWNYITCLAIDLIFDLKAVLWVSEHRDWNDPKWCIQLLSWLVRHSGLDWAALIDVCSHLWMDPNGSSIQDHYQIWNVISPTALIYDQLHGKVTTFCAHQQILTCWFHSDEMLAC